MDGYGYGYGASNWMKGGAPAGAASAASQQQRMFYPMVSSQAKPATGVGPGPKNKLNKVGVGAGVGYQDFQNYYPQQQHQHHQYTGADSGTGYFGYSSFLAQQSSNPQQSSGKRGCVGSFPKKIRYGYGMDAAYPPPSKRPKNYSTAGKTAAMILNELYPEFKDQCNYRTMTVNKLPRFECSFVVQGKTFSAEGSNKKAAKQLACELALKELRPDITVDVSVSTSEAKKLANCGFFAPQTNGPEGGRRKGLTSCNSLHDYFLRVCRERERNGNEKFSPQFTFTEIPSADIDSRNQKKFKCTLVLPYQGKVFTHEGYGKAPIKNAVIREALVEVFNVPQEQLKVVERRAMNLKPGKPMQVLIQALNFYDRVMQVEVDTVDGKPVQGNSRFICRITLDNNKTITGPPQDNKQKAKDSACEKVLVEELGLTLPFEDLSLKRAAAVLSPPYALHQLMVKQNPKKLPDIVYDEPQDISEAPNKPPMFKCTLTVNGTEKFEGVGQSKKTAKSAAAEQALVKLFKFDMSSENALEMLTVKKSKHDEKIMFCSEMCSFVRQEYEGICHQQACPITTHIAAIVLIAPDGEKQMVALGAGRNAVIDGHILVAAQGNVLVHMQSVVLARRAFLLYLHNQIKSYPVENSVVERCPTSNKFRLKIGYKVVLYASFPPNLRTGGEVQKLSCYMGGARPEATPEKLQVFDDIATSGHVYVMSLADKMLKWNYLGLQGALLSYILEPVFLTHICIGAPSNDKAVAHAVLLRFGDARKDELMIKSSQTGVVPRGEMYHDWVAGIGTVERLDPFTGRTVTGSPSRLCKSELYESWARVFAEVDSAEYKPIWSCAEAKRNEGVYQQALQAFHTQLLQNGLGMWQRKDSKIDSFQLASFDE